MAPLLSQCTNRIEKIVVIYKINSNQATPLGLPPVLFTLNTYTNDKTSSNLSSITTETSMARPGRPSPVN